MIKESDIQIACNDYLQYLCKYYHFRHFHVPNEGQKSIGYHFGTFQLTNESIDDPILDLEVAKKKYNLKNNEFIALNEGQTIMVE